jgi:hypothetical protein
MEWLQNINIIELHLRHMQQDNKQLDIHGYLTNWHKANKYFHYHQELLKGSYNKLHLKYPIISDARQSFYFRSILHLCNFLGKRQDLYLGNIISTVKNNELRENLGDKLKSIEIDQDYKSLFKLRNKWIGHRDNNWYKESLGFPDEKFLLYLDKIKEIMEAGFEFEIPITYANDLAESRDLLEKGSV